MQTTLNNYISKLEAQKILASHGLELNQPTGWDKLGAEIGSFLSDFGDFPAYDKEALYSWLGY